MFDFLRNLFKRKPSQREQNQQDMLQADYQRRVVANLAAQTAKARQERSARDKAVSDFRDNRQAIGRGLRKTVHHTPPQPHILTADDYHVSNFNLMSISMVTSNEYPINDSSCDNSASYSDSSSSSDSCSGSGD
jgi:hypothetical protein